MIQSKYKKILLQLLGVVFFFQVIRLLFYSVNHTFFEIKGIGGYLLAILYSLRFDISTVFTINLPFIFFALLPFKFVENKIYQKVLYGWFLFTNIIVFLFDIADIGYFPYVRKRMTIDVFNLLGRKSDFIDLLPSYVQEFWYVFLFVVLLMICFVLLNNRIQQRVTNTTNLNFVKQLGIWVITLGFSIIAVRGGLQLKPILANSALLYTSSQNANLILNTPFTIIHSYELGAPMDEYHFYSSNELKQYFNPIKNYRRGRKTIKPNIVIIVLESFGKSYTGIGGRKSHTPFLDSIFANSYVFSNAYANGHTSAMGIPAVIAGIPSFMNADFVTSPYANNQIDAMPSLLKKIGYSSSFFHGGTNGTMSFDIFASNAGYDRYFGRTEYNNDQHFDGTWGIWDEPYLQYYADELSKQKQPFFSSIFTLSSHEPFGLPKDFKNEEIRKLKSIQRGIRYTDQALREFFKTASKKSWFKNTLFVFTADHNFLVCQDSLKYYNNGVGLYAVPIAFYKPNDVHLKGTNNQTFQQINILPTVMDYIHYPAPFFAFGKSGFDTLSKPFWYSIIDNNAHFIFNDIVVTANDTNVNGLFDFKKDSLLQFNLMYNDSLKRQIIPYFKGYKQGLHAALIHNEMSVRKK